MADRIRLDNIREGFRNTHRFLSFSGIGYIFNYHLLYVTVMLSNGCLAVALLGYSLYYYRHQIDKLAVIVHHAILVIDVCSALVMGYVFKDQFENYLDGSYSTYNYRSALIMAKLNEVKEENVKNLSMMFKYLVYSLIYMLLDLAILALCERYFINEDILLVFPCRFPFELDSYPIYICVILWQEVIVTQIGIVVFSSLGLSHCVYSHVKSEIKILQYAMTNIKQRAYEMARSHDDYGEDELDDRDQKILKSCYMKCTSMCAEHHAEIIRYFNYGSTVVEIIYFLVFITGIVVCTCTGFALISDNTALKIKFIGITFIQLIYLFMMYWAGEETAEESMVIKDTVYTMEWYALPKECQSALIIMMIRSNRPLLMRLLTGQKVDLAGYMSLINASYSYFNMMLATTQ